MAILTLTLGLCGYRLYNHEITQTERISQLEGKVRQLAVEVAKLESAGDEPVAWLGGGVNYLAIGNSITVHPLAGYWWDSDRGMAASRDDRDYVRHIARALGEGGNDVAFRAFNFSAWETNGHDRAELLPMLDPYLSGDVNLVTLQLGENTTDLAAYEEDWKELIAYVKAGAPNAQVIVVGDFWSYGERDELKHVAAEASAVTYVSLDGIRDNPDYWVGLGAEVEGADGETHVIEHEGVSRHPGDGGMSAIAERVLAAIAPNE